MTSAFSRLFSRAQARFHRLGRWWDKRVQSGLLEEPLWPVSMLLSALLSPPKSPMSTMKVAVISLNSNLIICKSQKLLNEGDRYRLELLLPDSEPLEVLVVVDWVNLSSVAHSIGLQVIHKQNSRQILQNFCRQLSRPSTV